MNKLRHFALNLSYVVIAISFGIGIMASGNYYGIIAIIYAGIWINVIAWMFSDDLTDFARHLSIKVGN